MRYLGCEILQKSIKMYKKRKSASVGRATSEWEIEANRRLALWKQRLSIARALAHGKMVMDVAAAQGVEVQTDGGGWQQSIESSSLKEIETLAAKKMSEWDEQMTIVEHVVYSTFLVTCAREAGVDVDSIVKLPMLDLCERKDAETQVDMPCLKCVTLEKSLEEGMGEEEFNLPDSEIGEDY